MQTITDTRGQAYKANQLQISDKGVRYCGMPVKYVKRSVHPLFPSPSMYTIFGLMDMELGDISLNENDVKELDDIFTIPQ